ncbi:SDR family NAD(P)-dependent oxidoreductase [Kurthia sp. Dielmo]|uniref:SDR family NAD(P)-dependent oxidoreductase n=1 Tax=Kurthia sp. Dielmo TaxID=1033738 RepID=UPI00111CE53A|nr:SDR family oxidoreductase [Kurthia sp. Dielmo]
MAFATALAKEGAKVTIAEFNDETGAQAAKDIQTFGGEAIFVQCDVSDKDQVNHVVAETVAVFGTVNILVNNAQAAKPSVKLLDITLEDMEVPWKTCLVASLFFMQAGVPHIIDSNYGRIINLCSDTGIEGMPTFGAYGSAKESIRSLTRVAAREFGEYGITVNVVSPGALTPAAKRWMESLPKNDGASATRSSR